MSFSANLRAKLIATDRLNDTQVPKGGHGGDRSDPVATGTSVSFRVLSCHFVYRQEYKIKDFHTLQKNPNYIWPARQNELNYPGSSYELATETDQRVSKLTMASTKLTTHSIISAMKI